MAWKIMENLENEKSIFQTWKNHGIWKKGPKSWKNHGISKYPRISISYWHIVYSIITVITFISCCHWDRHQENNDALQPLLTFDVRLGHRHSQLILGGIDVRGPISKTTRSIFFIFHRQINMVGPNAHTKIQSNWTNEWGVREFFPPFPWKPFGIFQFQFREVPLWAP